MYYMFISALRVKQYKVKRFLAEEKKLKITDKALIETVKGFMSLDTQGQQRHALGAGLYKLRLASVDGKGKSGGSRTILEGVRKVHAFGYLTNDLSKNYLRSIVKTLIFCI